MLNQIKAAKELT